MSAARSGLRAAGFRQWIRHHTVACISTAADYLVMVVCVELLRVRPVPATLVAALFGAVTSFLLSRYFTFRATDAAVSAHVWRYALVSLASLGLNAAGEHLFHNVLGLQYMLARLITSILVSNAWNYPLQRFFVFSPHTSSGA